ncbi:aspartyl/glutamyl-tRNA amidotransferase subunit A [Mycoplasmoides pneumoniae]|uniref:Asp-tRNA(Asn)/Glu-tRNA(Gln) amidotransferase subunit GatA n=1 Tax=Mycoplasmoides pneumoniae TaxID=2104 RepID=UPI000A29F05F|nr:Asp-tRNA(Asn)/Glu-tRNA(Gln) amidotransferase subunit GatA [Mycoplasmoides pneumoniae]ARQ43597.1 aspartyl/glutamyl-tRNA amidotransferase subunit A [Mycoplasmoides pneumoniae]
MKSQILKLQQTLTKKPASINPLLQQIDGAINEHWSSNFLLKNTVEWAQAQAPKNRSKSPLNNIPFVLKDNIATKGIVTTGGSRFLEDYIPPFSATVFELLNNSGALLVGKANLDEFGLGGTGLHSGFGFVHHPWNETLIPGGSSSGSAYAVARGIVPFSIGTDTGDSVRRPASICNIVGFKPTYGLISRNGVYPYAPSLDHVGIFARYVYDVALVSDEIIKHDKADFSAQKSPDAGKFTRSLKESFNKQIKIGYLKPLEEWFDIELSKKWNSLKERITLEGCELIPFHFPLELLEVIDPVYKLISYSEAVSCYSNLTGIVFGQKLFEPNQASDFSKTITANRDRFFGEQLKRRFIIGAFGTDKNNFTKYFEKAQKIRRVMVDAYLNLFKEADFIVSPSASGFTKTIAVVQKGESFTNLVDDFLQLANFAGNPSITIPWLVKQKDQTIGLSVNANCFHDKQLLQVAAWLEELFQIEHDD